MHCVVQLLTPMCNHLENIHNFFQVRRLTYLQDEKSCKHSRQASCDVGRVWDEARGELHLLHERLGQQADSAVHMYEQPHG